MPSNAPAVADPPTLDLDPFSAAFLGDPYPFHERLREAAPVVRLSAYGVWGAARHAEVQAGLQDWEGFSSASGVGLADFRKETPWRPPSIILEADPPLHSRTRQALQAALSPRRLAELKTVFAAEAERLIDRLLDEGGEFDAVADLAEVYPIKVFADALGLSEEGREHLLPYAALTFNAFGPRNALFQEAAQRGVEAVVWVGQQCRRSALAPEGLGAAVFEAADSGLVSEDEAGMLVRSLLSAGLDTTAAGLGNTLYAFAANPEQWPILRDNPGLARGAFEEVLRYESPVQTFFRTTTRPIELGGTLLGEGEKVLLFLGAANRDPRRWENPDAFDVRRRANGNVAFGAGIHGCVGQMVARLEAEVVLAAMATRVKSIELAGAPMRRLNNTLRSLERLPVRLLRV